MSEMKEKDNCPTFNNIWQEFSETTGFHGVNKIGTGRNSKWRSVFWVLLWLSSASYVIYIVTTELQHYYQYPTTVTVSARVEDKLDFPAVVICNLATRNKDAFSNDPRTENYYLTINGLVQGLSVNWTDPFYLNNGYFKNRSMEDLYSESKNISELIKHYRFDNDADGLIVVPTATSIGLCVKVIVDKSRSTRLHGALYNLQMLLDLQRDADFYSYNYLSSGLKVAVYDGNEEPELLSDGIFIPPASEAYVEVSRKEFKYLPEPYKAFRNGICELSEPGYSMAKCVKECMREKLLKRSNCVDFDFESGTMIQNEVESCACPEKCEFVKYETSMSFAQFPSDLMLKILAKGANKTENYIGRNYISLNIFYKDLQTTVTEQKPKYETVGDVFSNIGGQMGLFLGASILTAMELAEFILFVFCNIFGRLFKNKVESTTSEKKIPEKNWTSYH